MGPAVLIPTEHVLLSLVILLTAGGCQFSGLATKEKPVTVQRVALQRSDVSGLQRCTWSGDVETVLLEEKSKNPSAYALNATEWQQWKRLGASDAYFAAYGRTVTDCEALSGSGTGAPSGGLLAALIVRFKSEATAVRTYRTNATLLGFGPKDIAFINLVGGTVTIGSATGLGQRSVIGSGSVTSSTYYFAFWQKKVFDAYLVGYDMPAADAHKAANDVNQRIR
jgi:hypothetical protein